MRMIFGLLASASSLPVAFMSDTCEVVVVGGVRVNKADYDANPKAYSGKVGSDATNADAQPTGALGVIVPVPEGVIIPPAPSAPNFAAAPDVTDQTPPAGPVPPSVPSATQLLVMKKAKKYLVVDATGAELKGREGIDEKGYDSEEAARKAIADLPQDGAHPQSAV